MPNGPAAPGRWPSRRTGATADRPHPEERRPTGNRSSPGAAGLADVRQETALEARFRDFSESKALPQRGPNQTFGFDPPRAILNIPAGWSGDRSGGTGGNFSDRRGQTQQSRQGQTRKFCAAFSKAGPASPRSEQLPRTRPGCGLREGWLQCR